MSKKKRKPKNSRHLGIRLNIFDLVRATEQTAVLLSPTRGCRREPNMIGLWAIEAMLGYFTQCRCHPRFVHEDDYFKATADMKRRWKSYGRSTDGRFPTGHFITRGLPLDDDLRLDICLNPVDGRWALSHGYDGGTISILAAAEAGSFQEDLADRYLVVAIDPRAKLPASRFLPKQASPRDMTTLLKEIRKYLDEVNTDMSWQFTVGLGNLVPDSIKEDQRPTTDYAPFGKKFRCHRFHGSSTAGALTAFFAERMGVHAFVSVARKTQVATMAVAAHATLGHLLAIPLEPRKENGPTSNGTDDGRGEKHRLRTFEMPANSVVATEYDLVRNPDGDEPHPNACVVATGITDNLILHGVRARSPDMLAVQSVLLATRTQSKKFLKHEFHVGRSRVKLIRAWKSTEEAITEYRQKAETT